MECKKNLLKTIFQSDMFFPQSDYLTLHCVGPSFTHAHTHTHTHTHIYPDRRKYVLVDVNKIYVSSLLDMYSKI